VYAASLAVYGCYLCGCVITFGNFQEPSITSFRAIWPIYPNFLPFLIEMNKPANAAYVFCVLISRNNDDTEPSFVNTVIALIHELSAIIQCHTFISVIIPESESK
jgi:hypothetical protein